jgi:2-aminoadipate transaminase
MTGAWQSIFAARTARLRDDSLRRMIEAGAQPGMISLAGGLPAPEAFPVDEYRRAFLWALETVGREALQYGSAQGYLPLRDLLSRRLGRVGIRCAASDLLITGGSQQALDLVAKVFLDPGDVVVVEDPTYVGALRAFDAYEPRYAVVPTDDDGMRVDVLEQLLIDGASRPGPGRIKLVYALPTFQNPSGRTMSLARRRRLVELAQRFGLPVIEDDPYGELRYEGEHLPSLKSLDTYGDVIHLGSFSKILAPGVRLGWLVARPEALEVLLDARQAADLHTGLPSQIATCRVAEGDFLDGHIARLRGLYRERRDAMLEAIDAHLPDDVVCTRPAGGMFVWLDLPAGVDTFELLEDCLRDRVAFVPGGCFHANGSGRSSLRLNFSNATPDTLREGVRRLGGAIQRRLAGIDRPRHIAPNGFPAIGALAAPATWPRATTPA